MSWQLLSPLSPLVARDISKAYGDRVVLDGVDLIANPGRPLGLVGENGWVSPRSVETSPLRR
jgi:macrolide transport system ATP-binding/permease protein